MVNPGALSFAIIRGIAFDEVILQCRDEKVLVSGVLTPDVTGLYVPCGKFAGYDLFILAGAPSYFLYVNPIGPSYIISDELTTGVPANYWVPTVALLEPSGSYNPAGGAVGLAAANDNPADLTGYAAEAVVRRSEKTGAEVVLDLQPAVTNAVFGEITIPSISKDDTELLEFAGNFRWDLVLRLISTGERFGPFARGQFVISDNITQPVI